MNKSEYSTLHINGRLLMAFLRELIPYTFSGDSSS